MQYRLVGGLRAVGPDGSEVDLGGPKQRAVLAALMVAEGRTLTPAAIIDRVWGDDPPARVETSLQAYVSNLRRAIEPTGCSRPLSLRRTSTLRSFGSQKRPS